jgi:glucose dehydrogenase
MVLTQSTFRMIYFCWLSLATSLYAADWLTFGHDPQRTGWAEAEKKLTPQNVGGLELKWKVQMKNEPKSLTALTAPLVASEVTTPQGIKTLVYVAGSSNHFFALDAENGRRVALPSGN